MHIFTLQGIAASSQSVVLLEQTLDHALSSAISETDRNEVLASLGATFQPLLAKNLDSAWTLAVKTDSKYEFLSCI